MSDNGSISSSIDADHHGYSDDDYYYYYYYDDEEFEELWETKAAQNIYMYLSLHILAIGVTCNIFSFIVFSRGSVSRSVSSLLFRALAVFDSLLLITALPRYWIRAQYDINLDDLSVVLCKFQPYIVYWSKDLSGWILSLIAVERLLAESEPTWTKRYLTITRARVVLGVLIGVCLLTNLTIPISHIMKNDSESDELCIMDSYWQNFNQYIWPYLDLLKHSLFPFCIIFSCNVAILFVIIRARRDKSRCAEKGNIKRNLSSKTCILLTVSVVYLGCSLPASLIYLLREIYSEENMTEKEYAKWDLCHAVAVMLIAINSAVNFILYCVSSKKFRQAVKTMFVKDRTCTQNTEFQTDGE